MFTSNRCNLKFYFEKNKTENILNFVLLCHLKDFTWSIKRFHKKILIRYPHVILTNTRSLPSKWFASKTEDTDLTQPNISKKDTNCSHLFEGRKKMKKKSKKNRKNTTASAFPRMSVEDQKWKNPEVRRTEQVDLCSRNW